jgi:hypothetical protein
VPLSREHALGVRIFPIKDILKRMESLPHLRLIVILVQSFLEFVPINLLLAKSRVFCIEEMHALLDLEIGQEDHETLFFLLLF